MSLKTRLVKVFFESEREHIEQKCELIISFLDTLIEDFLLTLVLQIIPSHKVELAANCMDAKADIDDYQVAAIEIELD